MTNMKIEAIMHDLAELEKHVAAIQVNIYGKLGLVDNYAPTDKVCYKRCKIEFELFTHRMKDLQIQLLKERDKQALRKD